MVGSTKEERLEWVRDTWDKYGTRIQALSDVVYVRTDTPQRILPSGIILPDNQVAFFAGLPKGKTPWATVVAAGPKTDVEVGDRVCFLRLDFAWTHRFHDMSYLGYARNETLLLKDTPEG
jgi:co-chaperonin GroES (HSP10)